MNSPPATLTSRMTVCVVGLESTGKSTLLQSLTGISGRTEALRGATLFCQSYPDTDLNFLDTPGLVRASDSATTREALDALALDTSCVLVVRAFVATQELSVLWPLVKRKRVALVLTHRDLLSENSELQSAFLETWRESLGVPIALLNAKRLSEGERSEIRRFVHKAGVPRDVNLEALPSWTLKTPIRKSPLLDNRFAALLLLFGPAFLATYLANSLADKAQPWMAVFIEKLHVGQGAGSLVSELLFGPYGLISMLPFLLLYALPTIVLFSFLLAIYKSTGLIDRLCQAVHPLVSTIGLGGRDAVRVVMGFGCNVPAVLATRACHSCSRASCVSAISFGAACSYQLPATLAVFSAAGQPELVLWYLGLLLVTTALYLRFTVPNKLRMQGRKLLVEEPGVLHPPNWKQALHDTTSALKEFFRLALPVFITLCVVAGLLHFAGALDLIAKVIEPVMWLLQLPPEAGMAVILGSVRKDGIALGLLDSSWKVLKVPTMTPGQLLTSVYLAGVFLPCLVTLFTVAKEMGSRHAVRLALRQAGWASFFAFCVGTFCSLIGV